jgi:hypothetical protein
MLPYPSPAKRGRVASEASRVGVNATSPEMHPHPSPRFARRHPPPAGEG